MPVDKAPREVIERLAALCNTGYPDLEKLNVKIGCVFVTAATNDDGDVTGSGLSRGGYPAAWVAKVTSPDQRLTGAPDVLLKLNGDEWDDWSEERQESVLDEFLYSIEIVKDRQTNQPVPDNAGRPKLRLKKFDIHIQGFTRIVQRHREATLCQVALDRALDRLSQKTMDFV